MGSWKKRIIKQLINFAILSIKLSFLELCLLIIIAKFPAQPSPSYGSQVVSTTERNVCSASLRCCWCLPLSCLKSQTWSEITIQSICQRFDENQAPSRCLSACSTTIRKPASTFYFFGGFCRYMTDTSSRVCCSVCFIFYFPFWKWGLYLCPVAFLSPSAAMVLPFLLQTLCCPHQPCEFSGMSLSPCNL